jgi:hypothetical protein
MCSEVNITDRQGESKLAERGNGGKKMRAQWVTTARAG